MNKIERIAKIIEQATYNAPGKKLGHELKQHFEDAAKTVIQEIELDTTIVNSDC